jgi:hypothetical protein
MANALLEITNTRQRARAREKSNTVKLAHGDVPFLSDDILETGNQTRGLAGVELHPRLDHVWCVQS